LVLIPAIPSLVGVLKVVIEEFAKRNEGILQRLSETDIVNIWTYR
jgi:hypothetical protein